MIDSYYAYESNIEIQYIFHKFYKKETKSAFEVIEPISLSKSNGGDLEAVTNGSCELAKGEVDADWCESAWELRCALESRHS